MFRAVRGRNETLDRCLIGRRTRMSGHPGASLLRGKVIKRCEWHEGILLRGEQPVTDAYRLANYLRESDADLPDRFPTSRDITDAIKGVDDEIALHDCPKCDKLLERD